MKLTRRDALRRGFMFGAAATAAWSGPGALVRALRAADSGSTRRLVFVELDGGNDGLNTIVPHGLDGGVYAALYRPALAVPAETVIPITDVLGFNPRLAPLMPLWDSGRMAVVQGVGSPLPTFSHDFAKKIWATGDPTGAETKGWFGRFLATLPSGKSRAFDVASYADSMFAGSKQFVPAFRGLEDLEFPIDEKHEDDAGARKKAFVAMHSALAADSAAGPVSVIGATGEKLVAVIDEFSKVKSVSHAGSYPNHAIGDALKLVVRLMKSKLGLHYHHVVFDGFDTHAAQNAGFSHDHKLETLSLALAAFHADLAHHGLAQDTLIVVYSEFGRAVYENASLGTDHGTAGPVIVIGESVAGGLHRDHPSLASESLSPIQELVATTDYRDVLGTVALRWLGIDPGPLFPGHVATDLGFLA